ncbi:hypothetical protein [Desulforamulus ferrireducens]|uniref:hypothetical protein n=1 Tax=Desulforamulus ferrireducens TaxID=1833852 RepID=UPI001A9A56F6|nr:hypothetical protein [Desulforamulus ferrireducens]
MLKTYLRLGYVVIMTIGVLLLLLGLVGALVMLCLAIRSAEGYPIQCKRCGHAGQIPAKPGEYRCPACGVPLARVEEK